MTIPLKLGATLTSLPCKICASKAPLVGSLDFNKACQGLNAEGIDVGWASAFGISKILVPYYRCSQCLFLFTDFFDHWSDDDWQTHIYNDQYHRIDPDGQLQGRPTAAMAVIDMMFQSHKASLSILDYGGGEGYLATLLTQRGYQASSYDRFMGSSRYPDCQFDLIMVVEVLEHVCDPHSLIKECTRLLQPEGVLFITTPCIDTPSALMALYDSNVAPRNGHVSIHSTASLGLLTASQNLQQYIVNINGENINAHFFVKGNPLWFHPELATNLKI